MMKTETEHHCCHTARHANGGTKFTKEVGKALKTLARETIMPYSVSYTVHHNFSNNIMKCLWSTHLHRIHQGTLSKGLDLCRHGRTEHERLPLALRTALSAYYLGQGLAWCLPSALAPKLVSTCVTHALPLSTQQIHIIRTVTAAQGIKYTIKRSRWDVCWVRGADLQWARAYPLAYPRHRSRVQVFARYAA